MGGGEGKGQGCGGWWKGVRRRFGHSGGEWGMARGSVGAFWGTAATAPCRAVGCSGVTALPHVLLWFNPFSFFLSPAPGMRWTTSMRRAKSEHPHPSTVPPASQLLPHPCSPQPFPKPSPIPPTPSSLPNSPQLPPNSHLKPLKTTQLPTNSLPTPPMLPAPHKPLLVLTKPSQILSTHLPKAL